MTEWPDDFDPESIADITERMVIAELEESTTLVTYMEMTVDTARALIDAGERLRRKDWSQFHVLLEVALALCDSARDVLAEEGLLDDEA